MPATFVLTTPDQKLLASWTRQIPSAPYHYSTLEELQRELLLPGARVWIRDLCDASATTSVHQDTVIISVGKEHSIPFEEGQLNRPRELFLSYAESAKELRRLCGWASELAEQRASLSVGRENRPRRLDSPSAPPFEIQRRMLKELEFIETAVEHLEDLQHVIETFKRGFKANLRVSRVLIFLRAGRQFIDLSLGESQQVSQGDVFVHWLQQHAGIVDTTTLATIEDIATEVQLRHRMQSWNARLLLPIEVHGVFLGWVTFGPKADGRNYTDSDREDALDLVSLLSRFLGKHKVLTHALAAQRDLRLINNNGPRFRLLSAEVGDEEGLPVEVQEVVGLCRRDRMRVEREFGRMRVSAGPIIETGGWWVSWDEEGGTADSVAEMMERERYQQLHELGLLVSHEMSNALFSVSTYFQHVGDGAIEAAHILPLLPRVYEDMGRLKNLPHMLGGLYEMSRRGTSEIKMKSLIEDVAREVDGSVEIVGNDFLLWGHEENLKAALGWICAEIKLRSEAGSSERAPKIKITLQQRQRDGSEPICLIIISYPGLRVEQLRIGAPAAIEEYPTVPVYVARQIIRYHHGTIHIGQGLDGPEVNIALKSRRVEGSTEIKSPSELQSLHAADFILRQNARSVLGEPTASAATTVNERERSAVG